MRWQTLAMAAVVIGLVVAAPAVARPTDEQVEQAIQRGIDYLWTLQQPDGSFSADHKLWWTQSGAYDHGCEAIACMALAVAGVPLTDERMKKAIDYIVAADTDFTYIRACRVVTLARLINRKDREPDPRFKAVLDADAKWLVKFQLDDKFGKGNVGGMWNYGDNKYKGTNPDFSNTQFALLALQEYEMAGGELENSTFERAMKIYLERQKADGGWNYGWLNAVRQDGTPALFDTAPYGSMTAAGCASLFIIRDHLFSGMGCPCKGGKSGRSPDKLDVAIDKSIEWLGRNYKADNNPTSDPKEDFGHFWYWHYSCERVGLASGLKYFGQHDWYGEGADMILKRQGKDGGWSGPRNIYDTCYNIMFLVKGRAPILLNKLQFAGAWGLHPRDAANLAKYVGQAKEQPMNWQVINLSAPVEEWHDAPILYISAETAIKLADEDKKKLRQYTNTGGTILFEASCANQTVTSWWKKTCTEIWPEWELKHMEKDHPLWTADLKLVGQLPTLFEASDGVRSFLLFAGQDISCAWHTQAMSRNRLLFDLGCNLYAYTTDRGRLRGKLASARVVERKEFADAKPTAGTRNTVRTRLLQHGGDWYITRHYAPLAILADYLKERAGLTLQLADPASATEENLKQTDVVWLTGRKTVTLSTAEIAALQKWLRAGGYLVAEACMGDPAFDAAFATVAKDLGLQVRTVGRNEPLVSGAMDGMTGFKLDPLDFTFALRTDRVGRQFADLRGLYLDGALVGVYSPADVSLAVAGIKAFGNRGYAISDGRAVATNMILPATARGVAAATDAPKTDASPADAPKADVSTTQPAAEKKPDEKATPLPSGYEVTPN
jgi:hypothetical protein